MPNWCNNFITFWSDGTPEGNAALADLHNKIEWTYNLMKQISPNNRDLWEVYIANYGFGVDISCYQRGYIYWIGDIVGNGTEFSVECDDAWSPNIQFWQALLYYFYQNKVSFTFQASEPGMQIYETNDPGILPRYNVNICAEGVNELLTFDKLWDWNNPLFPKIDNDYVNNCPGQWVKYPCSGFDENGNRKYYDRWCMPSISYWNEFDGDEDGVIGDIEELITIQPTDTIDDIGAIPGISVNEWQYVDIDNAIEQEELCDKICSKIGDREAMTPYGKVSPIYDNFTTFLGGDSNE